MASGLRWSPEAVEDVEQIAAFIARDSEHYAQAVVARVLEVAESALRFPLRGRIVPELRNPAVRELFAHGYRVIYRVESSVIVLAVIHERRSLQAPLGLDG